MMANGGCRGNLEVIMSYRKLSDGSSLTDWQDEELQDTRDHRPVPSSASTSYETSLGRLEEEIAGPLDPKA